MASRRPKRTRDDGDGGPYVRDEDGNIIELDSRGYEARSEDEEDDNGSDLEGFVVPDDVEEDESPDDPSGFRSALVDVDPANIVEGRRVRRPVQRYVDTEDFRNLYNHALIAEHKRAERLRAAQKARDEDTESDKDKDEDEDEDEEDVDLGSEDTDDVDNESDDEYVPDDDVDVEEESEETDDEDDEDDDEN